MDLTSSSSSSRRRSPEDASGTHHHHPHVKFLGSTRSHHHHQHPNISSGHQNLIILPHTHGHLPHHSPSHKDDEQGYWGDVPMRSFSPEEVARNQLQRPSNLAATTKTLPSSSYPPFSSSSTSDMSSNPPFVVSDPQGFMPVIQRLDDVDVDVSHPVQIQNIPLDGGLTHQRNNNSHNSQNKNTNNNNNNNNDSMLMMRNTDLSFESSFDSDGQVLLSERMTPLPPRPAKRGPSWPDRNSLLGDPEDIEVAKLYFRATVGIYGSLLFWVGGWSLISPEPKTKSITNAYHLLPERDYRVYLGFALVGLLFMFISDTLYGNAGYDGNYTRFVRRRAFSFLRFPLAILGSVLMWIGLYTLFDRYVFSDSYLRDSLYLLFGLLMLVGSNTVSWMAYIYPDEYDFVYLSEDSPFMAHLRFAVRSSISILGQTFIWIGAYNLLENHNPRGAGDGWWREVFYCALGLLLLVSTDSYIACSWISVPEDGEEEGGADNPGTPGDVSLEFMSPTFSRSASPEPLSPPPSNRESISSESHLFPDDSRSPQIQSRRIQRRPRITLFFAIRLILSLTGQMLHITGGWTILEYYSVPIHWWVHVVFLVCGCSMLLWAKTFWVNFGISEVTWFASSSSSKQQ